MVKYQNKADEWWNSHTLAARTYLFELYKEVLSAQDFTELKLADIETIYKIGNIVNKPAKETESQTTYNVLNCIPYQCCPVCNGEGQVVADGFTSAVYQPCKVCNGARIIPMHVIVTAPVKYGILGSLCNHNFEHKDAHWKSCVNCGLLEPINK